MAKVIKKNKPKNAPNQDQILNEVIEIKNLLRENLIAIFNEQIKAKMVKEVRVTPPPIPAILKPENDKEKVKKEILCYLGHMEASASNPAERVYTNKIRDLLKQL